MSNKIRFRVLHSQVIKDDYHKGQSNMFLHLLLDQLTQFYVEYEVDLPLTWNAMRGFLHTSE